MKAIVDEAAIPDGNPPVSESVFVFVSNEQASAELTFVTGEHVSVLVLAIIDIWALGLAPVFQIGKMMASCPLEGIAFLRTIWMRMGAVSPTTTLPVEETEQPKGLGGGVTGEGVGGDNKGDSGGLGVQEGGG